MEMLSGAWIWNLMHHINTTSIQQQFSGHSVNTHQHSRRSTDGFWQHMTEGTAFRLKKAQNDKKKPRHSNNNRQLLLMTTHWTFTMNERLHTRATANWLHPLPLLNCILSYRSLTTKERPSSQFQSRDPSRDIAFSALMQLCLQCFDAVSWVAGRASGL